MKSDNKSITGRMHSNQPPTQTISKRTKQGQEIKRKYSPWGKVFREFMENEAKSTESTKRKEDF